MNRKIDMTVWKCTNPPKGIQNQMFPSRFLLNLKRYYPYEDKYVLWMFSGSIDEGGDTTDIRVETNAKIIAPYDNLPIKDNTYDVVVADPPYNQLFAKEWKADFPKPKRILREASRVTKPNGLIFILHCLVIPEYRKEIPVERIALHPVLCGLNNAIRVLNVYKKKKNHSGISTEEATKAIQGFGKSMRSAGAELKDWRKGDQ